MKCSECGNEININETECKNCGCSVSEMNVNSNQEYINVNTNMNTDTIEKNKNQNIISRVDNWLDKSIENNLNNSYMNKTFQSNKSNDRKTQNQKNTEKTILLLDGIATAISVFGFIGSVIIIFVAIVVNDDFVGLYVLLGIACFCASIISSAFCRGLSYILDNLYEINRKI